MRALSLMVVLLVFVPVAWTQVSARPDMQLGVDADDWNNQIRNPEFEKSLKRMQVDFISWHIQPEEEANAARIDEIVKFCRRNHWHYLFNTEVGNYRRNEPRFDHVDGTYRYDLADTTLKELKDDSLFVGVVYDEADLVQAMLGEPDGKGSVIKPYFADTRKLAPVQAFFAVTDAVSKIETRYKAAGKIAVFEMTFPDSPFAFARAGALTAPKLLKENFNDLMFAVYRGAALEYKSKELWACIDLWFLDKFPFGGKRGAGYHTPVELGDALRFAYNSGFDRVYVEQVKALVDDHFELTDYGMEVVEFQSWRKTHSMGDWRTGKIDLIVRRFPDGYWGQAYSTFIPDHPYGSLAGNPNRALDLKWFQFLNQHSKGAIPLGADTWNAQLNHGFKSRPYQALAGLPAFIVTDPFGSVPVPPNTKAIDLTH